MWKDRRRNEWATDREGIIIENMLISEFAAFGQIIKKAKH